ncbi:RibB 34-dihydroxy-2-butanone 4-phosphate synthase [Pyrenophora tritici-repentis]|nr:RibB 34-dihydroxy-2-butanone 4-phosphate synthase [Pyrenophora tritici-repentis]KAI1602671.1 RibB 34-dihydroxy-2-butanone 4-phosphate synthase [Pyrenophora tritici-repentis]PWO25693.1 methyltransferase [Pyrenophora tritici-repentis]PZD27684.1 RibB, 3,4-dihydroxy-2-butanone 4-phosphate synthase [Pyrenophora tritici-repentis]
MPAEQQNGLPVNGTNGVNGNMTNSTPSHPAFDSIPDVIQAFANDEFVIVLDSPSRENEGDLIIAASALTPSKASFMIRYSSGYICAPLPVSRAAALHLPQMVADNADPNRTAYAVSIDAADPSDAGGSQRESEPF